MSEVEQRENRKKRKRNKKTFLKNARKYAKEGHYGRGKQLDASTYQYIVRIMEVYREGFDQEDDKSIFVNNVFEQMVDKETDYACNQVGCRAVEMLLPFANDTTLERFMMAFGGDLRRLCSDQFASHVIESLLTQTCTKSLSNDTNSEWQVKYKEFTIKISKFLLNNLEDYVWDTYGNHVVRSVLRNLARLPKLEGDKKNSRKEVMEDNTEIPQEYLDIVTDYAERLMTWPQFNDLPYSELTSGLLQVLLGALVKCNSKLSRKYLKKLVDESFSPETLDEANSRKWAKVFTSDPALMLLEAVLPKASPKLYRKINNAYFVGKLVSLAKTRATNFAVQKLLTYCADKTELEAMFEELSSNGFEEIVAAGHSGVILALAQACKRLATKQGSFVQTLMKALHCWEPEDRQNSFVICLSKFASFEHVEETPVADLENEKLSLHGTLILQVLLDFNKPIKIVLAILSMQADDVRKLSSNCKGSHIIDSYLRSEYVGEKSREKLIRKLQGCYQELAACRYGSRSFEALWKACSLKLKLMIMEELCSGSLWSHSAFGKIIAAKINLSLYKRSKEEWKNSLSMSSKVKELTDLLK